MFYWIIFEISFICIGNFINSDKKWYLCNVYCCVVLGMVCVVIVVIGEDDLKGIGWILIKVNGIERLFM